VMGDRIYKMKGAKNDVKANRQMLHAKSIKFGLFDKDYEFETDMPEDFGQFLTKVK
jgi:23S rRNA-/tRNA-specific pseudouridylate synthase